MSHTRNLVIVGGGFAGITLAEQLEHRLPPEWKLTLVSQENSPGWSVHRSCPATSWRRCGR